MLQFNSALLAAVGSFTGKYAPYQSVLIQPHAGGILLAASDAGRICALGFDPRGSGDESVTIIPSNDLLKACAGIKTAERGVTLDGHAAVVTTYYKSSSSQSKEFPLHHSTAPFPPLDQAIAACLDRWGATPQVSATAGRYRTGYLERAIKHAGLLTDSLVLSAFDGGPLRLHAESYDLVLLLMPQAAEPIPPIPDWLSAFGRRDACHIVHPG